MSSLSFTSPLLLLALIGLPALCWLLRVMPPPARNVVFPPIAFLLRLKDKEETAHHTPLWLLLLRIFIAGLIIIGLAGPIINPPPSMQGEGPVVLVVDDGWASAATWPKRKQILHQMLNQAARDDRPVALVTTAPDIKLEHPTLMTVAEAKRRLDSLEPKPWSTNRAALAKDLPEEITGDILWLMDDVRDGGEDELARALLKRGTLRRLSASEMNAALALHPPNREGATLKARISRATSGKTQSGTVRAINGRGQSLGSAQFELGQGDKEAIAEITLPMELQNTITRLEIKGERSAGAVSLMDDTWQRRSVGIVTAGTGDIDKPLLSDVFYLDRATAPFAESQNGTLEDLMKTAPSAIIMPDMGQVPAAQMGELSNWIEGGGLLIRFAGPRLALKQDNLVAVPLRQGGRAFGGALSWDEPQALAPFDQKSPFFGLTIAADVTVSKQVLAEPSIELASHTWARISDGTPLVTARKRGEGWTVLFHITATPDWSTLPISGLFVEMLERTVSYAKSEAIAPTDEISDGDVKIYAQKILSGFGDLQTPTRPIEGVSVQAFQDWTPSPSQPPGLYERPATSRALNLVSAQTKLEPLSDLPAAMGTMNLGEDLARDLKPLLLTLALLLALIDGMALLVMNVDRAALKNLAGKSAAFFVVVFLFAGLTSESQADEGERTALGATLSTHLAYVKTGDTKTDRMSAAGLAGLTDVVRKRTAVEPGDPIGVDIERDELAFFPLIYWPISADHAMPSPAALEKLNRFMQTGGTIIFDTQDQQVQYSANANAPLSKNGERLREILTDLDIPPLTQVPDTHVLTKSFYLLRQFPGRWQGGKVWVEAQDEASLAGTSKTGSLNDGVSSVIIGSNDWISAWAIDANGRPMAATVPGTTRQRELAYRFGVNIVMYTLTGNYKADQVHVPALLERLGE